MMEQNFVYVDANYLKELEETAKKVDYYKGIIDGINMVADRKTENDSEIPNNCKDCEHWNDTEDGCADRHGCKTETQTDIHGLTDCDFCKGKNCEDCEGGKDEPQTNGYQTFNGTSVYVSRLEGDIQTDNGIGCSRCESRYDCYDRDMPHAVRCNNYGKVTDEPQTERSSK